MVGVRRRRNNLLAQTRRSKSSPSYPPLPRYEEDLQGEREEEGEAAEEGEEDQHARTHRSLPPGVEPGDDGVEHVVSLGFVEDLVVEAVEFDVGLVG